MKLFFSSFLSKTFEDDCFSLASDLAFQMFFSMFPFFLFLISLFGYMGIEQSDIQSILSFIENTFPETTKDFLQRNLEQLIEQRSNKLFSISLIGTIYLVTNALSSALYSLNRIFHAEQIQSFLKRRMKSLFLFIGFIFTFFFSSIMILSGIENIRYLGNYLNIDTQIISVVNIVNIVYPFLSVFITILVLYYVAPIKKLKLRCLAPGALFFTLSWYLITYMFSYYVDNIAKFNVAFSVIGVFLITLSWFYISSLLVLLGGEINSIIYLRRKQTGKAE